MFGSGFDGFPFLSHGKKDRTVFSSWWFVGFTGSEYFSPLLPGGYSLQVMRQLTLNPPSWKISFLYPPHDRLAIRKNHPLRNVQEFPKPANFWISGGVRLQHWIATNALAFVWGFSSRWFLRNGNTVFENSEEIHHLYITLFRTFLYK